MHHYVLFNPCATPGNLLVYLNQITTALLLEKVVREITIKKTVMNLDNLNKE